MNREQELQALLERVSTQLKLSEEKITLLDTINHQKISSIELKIDQNTAMTKEIVDLFTAFKGGFKVLGWLGNFVKWAASIGVAFGIMYSWYHDFKAK